MVIHIPIGSLKQHALGWSRYRDANPIPISPFADNLSTAPPGPVALGVGFFWGFFCWFFFVGFFFVG